MKSQVGLWIDYREAVIVTLNDDLEEIERVTSDVEALVSDADAPHSHIKTGRKNVLINNPENTTES